MTTIKILITLVLLLCTHLFSQNLWKPEKLINFTIQNNTKISSFVDASGIHILYYRNGGIKYALVNSQGDIIKHDKVIENDGAGTDFANVVADENNVYALYYKNNKIQVAKSSKPAGEKSAGLSILMIPTITI